MRQLVLFFLFTYSISSVAQQLLPLNKDAALPLERYLYKKSSAFHTEQKPYIDNEIYDFINKDSLINYYYRDSFLLADIDYKFANLLWRKLRKESLIDVNKEGNIIKIDPLFNFGVGTYGSDFPKTYTNMRGAMIRGKIGKKVAFFSSFYETQARYVDYFNIKAKDTKVIPGSGHWKNFKDDSNQYDFSTSAGIVSYSPSSHFNFQFGHNKNFFGDGYRSLLLSDVSSNYPYLKIKANFGKIEYTSMYAEFLQTRYVFSGENLTPKKYATFHFFSYNISKSFNVALFESTIWQSNKDGKFTAYQAKFLNPVIGLQSIIDHFDNVNNNILGLNLRYKISDYHTAYSQIVFDDMSLNNLSFSKGNLQNKLACQIGLKYFDVATIKNLFFLTELNMARPYTYSNSDSLLNYTNSNQALAHPLGANFVESVTIFNFRFKDLFAEYKFIYAVSGVDKENTNFGNDIFKRTDNKQYFFNSSNATMLNGIRNKLVYNIFRITYLVNPATNFNVYIEISDRSLNSSKQSYHTTWINFGIRTALDNFYYDF